MKALAKITMTLAAAYLIVTSPGCNRQSDEQAQPTICFAFQDLETEFWVAAHKAICEFATWMTPFVSIRAHYPHAWTCEWYRRYDSGPASGTQPL